MNCCRLSRSYVTAISNYLTAELITAVNYTVSQKKRANFETV